MVFYFTKHSNGIFPPIPNRSENYKAHGANIIPTINLATSKGFCYIGALYRHPTTDRKRPCLYRRKAFQISRWSENWRKTLLRRFTALYKMYFHYPSKMALTSSIILPEATENKIKLKAIIDEWSIAANS